MAKVLWKKSHQAGVDEVRSDPIRLLEWERNQRNSKHCWVHKEPYNVNEWFKLDLQQYSTKNITGIRVGTYKHDFTYYVS